MIPYAVTQEESQRLDKKPEAKEFLCQEYCDTFYNLHRFWQGYKPERRDLPHFPRTGIYGESKISLRAHFPCIVQDALIKA